MFLAAYTHLLKYSWNSMSSSKQTTAVSGLPTTPLSIYNPFCIFNDKAAYSLVDLKPKTRFLFAGDTQTRTHCQKHTHTRASKQLHLPVGFVVAAAR